MIILHYQSFQNSHFSFISFSNRINHSDSNHITMTTLVHSLPLISWAFHTWLLGLYYPFTHFHHTIYLSPTSTYIYDFCVFAVANCSALYPFGKFVMSWCYEWIVSFLLAQKSWSKCGAPLFLFCSTDRYMLMTFIVRDSGHSVAKRAQDAYQSRVDLLHTGKVVFTGLSFTELMKHSLCSSCWVGIDQQSFQSTLDFPRVRDSFLHLVSACAYSDELIYSCQYDKSFQYLEQPLKGRRDHMKVRLLIIDLVPFLESKPACYAYNQLTLIKQALQRTTNQKPWVFSKRPWSTVWLWKHTILHWYPICFNSKSWFSTTPFTQS